MSSYATLYVGAREVSWWRNTIDPSFLFLFDASNIRTSRDEVMALGVPPAVVAEREESEEERTTYVFTATVGELIDRMNALGISTDQTRETFVALCDEEVESLRSLREHTEYEALDAEAEALARYTYDAWLSDVQTASTSETWEEREASRTPYGLMRREWAENTDPRFVLRAYLDAVDPGETVMLDASDVLDGGWIEDGIDPRAVAANHYQSYLLHGLPAIVITEGRSDVEVLEAAISILRPHLRGYINFLDFSFNNEGGAAAAVKTLRALSAAGVANRVVLLLDNDTAGHEAVRNLRTTVLPSQYLIATIQTCRLRRHTRRWGQLVRRLWTSTVWRGPSRCTSAATAWKTLRAICSRSSGRGVSSQ